MKLPWRIKFRDSEHFPFFFKNVVRDVLRCVVWGLVLLKAGASSMAFLKSNSHSVIENNQHQDPEETVNSYGVFFFSA